MEQQFNTEILFKLKQKRRKKFWKRAVSLMMCVVVFCTTYALILPAITMETKTFCGIKEHTHEQMCYSEDALCGIHVHTDTCYEEKDDLICTEPTEPGHLHTETCAPVTETNLTCGLEEVPGHSHREECMPVSETALTCGVEETVGHTHGEGCGKAETLLSCGLEETPAHSHEPACFTNVLTCALPEDENHTHGEDCYSEQLSCTMAETDGHTHGDSCYSTVTTYVCGLEEIPAHTHGENCYTTTTVYGCGLEETAAHSHGEDCYTATTIYGCGLEEVPAHVHGDPCHQITKTLICTLEADPEHQHTEECGEPMLICEKEEHTHDLLCYSDPNADLESAADWEATLPDLTGIYAEDVLSIARSQLGYTESTLNYTVYEDDVKGYTRYGDWYGIPYGDWCAMFVSFCLHYAQVPDMPLGAGCHTWIGHLRDAGMYAEASAYTPNPGDLIFFEWFNNDNGISDHVGLVVEIIPGTETSGAMVRTIEGNAGNTVRYETYALDDRCILGYGMLPSQEKEETILYLCGEEEHTHEETCYDTAGNLICTMREHTHTEQCLGRKLIYSDNKIYATVTIRGVDTLPEDLSVSVWEITPEEDPATYMGMQNALIDQMTTESRFVENASYYGMELLSKDEPYELPAEANVKVDVEFVQPLFTAETVKNAAEMKTFMLTPQEAQPQTQAEAAPADAEIPVEAEPAAGLQKMGMFALRASEETGEEIEPIAYTAEPVSAEKYDDSEEGLASVSFRSSRIATFAVAVATDVQEGTFWTRVTDQAELAQGGTFMIVSAEGNYALVGTANSNYRPVTIQTVKGNTNYYTISGSDSADLRWTFTGSGNSYTIRNQGTNQHVNAGNQRFIANSSQNIKVSYHQPEKCWRLTGDVVETTLWWTTTTTYYLRNAGSGAAFYRDADRDRYDSGTLNSKISHYYTADMMLFKLSDVTALNVPQDVQDGQSGGTDMEEGPAKPDYGDIIDPSGSKQGDTAVTDTIDSSKTVSGKYYSDPATSDLESNYRKDTYAEHETIDGKVMTDKSVIYGADDYGAFDTYAANTFGVTLSALGQEHPVPHSDVVNIPIDVVFVLDVSGSMTNHTTADGETRISALSQAFNEAVTHIMEAHEENRIGVALYTSGAWEMLPLDRYKASKVDDVMQITRLEENVMLPYSSTARQFLVGSDSLVSETTGDSFANAGWTGHVGNADDIHQGVGTYPQAGLAVGYNILKANEDTTYTAEVNGREYEVKRQPVIVLLSDGEPTHATNIYMDPLNGPHYGDGNGDLGQGNIDGAQGYYTILSANYFKRMTGIHYEKEALFYTIGLGIKSAEEANDDINYDPDSNGSGDRYKRAVLNPSAENLEVLSSDNVNGADTSQRLKDLLAGNVTVQAVETRSQWPDPWTGIPHIWTPILQGNPYAEDFDYADEAFFGRMSVDELSDVFDNILSDSQYETHYGFVLYENSTVDISDSIGDGMEIKGDPILRYGGRNYTHTSKTIDGNTTTYVYAYTYKDPYIPEREINLADIQIKVITDANGNQMVDMYVPDTALPTYTPELIGKQYYYESLPVRLIYQVGLTEASRQDVLALAETGGKLTYYTNAFSGNEAGAIANLVPSTVNTFYIDVPDDDKTPAYHAHNEQKTENTTDTVTYHVDCSMGDHEDDETIHVYHKLGNNGKLEFEAEKPTLKIPVEKRWEGVNADTQEALTITLYKVFATENSATAQVLQTLELNKDNGWSGSFDNLQLPGSDWYYAVGETVPQGFVAIYSGETVKAKLVNGETIEHVTAVKVALEGNTAQKVTIKNLPGAELPNTGGTGTTLYTTGGLLLTIAAVFLLYMQNKKRRREDPYSP